MKGRFFFYFLLIQDWLLKNQKLYLSKTWVVFEESKPAEDNKADVIGYFTLTAHSLESSLINDNDVKLAKYQVPITLLARIAVDLTFQGQGLGREILYIALEQALHFCHLGLPSYGVVLDVLDEKALHFYQKFSFFRKLDNSDTKLFVIMATLETICNKKIN